MKESEREQKLLDTYEIVRLNNNLMHANKMIEQQNNHINYMHSHFSLFWGITGIIIAIIGLYGYFQYIKPLNEQRLEINELNKQSREILADLKGSISDQIEEERFNLGMEGLKQRDFYSQIGTPIIQEFAVRGFNNSQIERLDYFIRNDIKKIENDSQRESVATILIYCISVQNKNKIFDILFEDLMNKRLSYDGSFLESYYRRYSEGK